MKKIVVLENSFSASVTIRSALMDEIAACGYELYILSYGKEAYSKQLKNINATCIDIGTSNTNPLQILKYLRLLRKTLKDIEPFVCLTFTPRQNIYGNIVCRYLRIPTISNITGTGVPFHIKGAIYGAGRLLYRAVLRYPRAVFFQNRDDLKHLVSNGYVKPSRAILIPGSGVDTEKFSPRPREPHDKFVFLFIGRLVKLKGITELMVAAKRILKSNSKCEFVIVGPLWTQNTSKLTVSQDELNSWKQPGILFKGESSDVREFIAQCDCLVLPSYREGLSNALLEAASMEKAIVTTNVTGCKDVVVDGLNGILCEPKNALSLEAALRRMLALDNEERNEMGRQGRLKVRREYEKSLVVNRYIEKIHDCDPHRLKGRASG